MPVHEEPGLQGLGYWVFQALSDDIESMILKSVDSSESTMVVLVMADEVGVMMKRRTKMKHIVGFGFLK